MPALFPHGAAEAFPHTAYSAVPVRPALGSPHSHEAPASDDSHSLGSSQALPVVHNLKPHTRNMRGPLERSVVLSARRYGMYQKPTKRGKCHPAQDKENPFRFSHRFCTSLFLIECAKGHEIFRVVKSCNDLRLKYHTSRKLP
jgi:hypothetical protein